MTTVAELLIARAADDHPAILFEGHATSWAGLVDEAGRRAALATDRRRSGPFHIGVLLENVPEFLFWISGAALAGAAVVGINPTRRGAELAADIRHTDCQLLVTDAAGAALLDGLDTGVAPDATLLVDGAGYEAELRTVRPTRVTGAGARPDPSDTLLLLFTSGSTGAPKAVICSQGRFAGIVSRTPDRFGITRDDVLYQSMPLFHGNALMANWAPALGTGATVVLRRRFSASGFIDDVRRYRATYFNYVGRALAYILATPERPDDADNQLRLGFGTEASARDMERFSRRFGCRIMESYGSSEGAISILKTPDTPTGALGRPADGMEVTIVDPAGGAECPPAQFDHEGRLVNGAAAIGELVGRGGSRVFEGYYNNPEAEAQRQRGGHYWSGDLGYRDADGFIYFAGRSADWLRVDSENFAAAPVERILARHPDVVMVAVYAVADPRTGDQVMAAIELCPGAVFEPQSFATFLAQQDDLGTKWAPRFVRLVPSMPLTSTNKVDKQPLRAEGWATGDAVWWRPPDEPSYRPLTTADRRRLQDEFEEHRRQV